MKIKIEDLNQKLANGLKRRGLSPENAKIIVPAFVEAELRGKK
jgi:LDH2 family malate/lactate/ureidoglycolate dehydrogenase